VIVVDTSALLEVLFDQPAADQCLVLLEDESRILISAGTLAEAHVVAAGRNIRSELIEMVESLPLEVIPVTEAAAQRIGTIYAKWGKGAGTAGLNFGDCFAYELAQRYDCKLLYVGDDFSKTDVLSAI
jgi:ribonuclease VapC